MSRTAMFLKLLAVIAVMGAVSAALLVNRQHRLETAHRAALVHEELAGQRQLLWELRGEIAARCRPAEVRPALAELGGDWSACLPAPPGGLRHPQREPWGLAAAQTRPAAPGGSS